MRIYKKNKIKQITYFQKYYPFWKVTAPSIEFNNYNTLNNYDTLNMNKCELIKSYNLPIKEGESTYWLNNEELYQKFI